MSELLFDLQRFANIAVKKSKTLVSGTSGKDSIQNGGYDAFGTWHDSKSRVTIEAGAGDDSIYNNWDSSNDSPYVNNYSSNVVFQYIFGDGNDLIKGFKANSTLSIGGGVHAVSQKSGSDIIVTVDESKIKLMGAASLEMVNVNGTTGGNSTTLTVTNATKSPVTVDSAVKTINASARAKAVQITGNELDNSIVGGSGKDTLNGAAGNDTIWGGSGNDIIGGNAGNDLILGETGNDKLWGDDGDDTLSGGKGNDELKGGTGNDSLSGGDDNDTLWGGSGNDIIGGNAGNDIITDYATEDKISIKSGTANVMTRGNNVVFTVGKGKITVKNAKNKVISYVDANGEHNYSAPTTSNVSINGNGTAIKLLSSYLNDTFDVADYGEALQTIDATSVVLDINIKGNRRMNNIIGGDGNDTLRGGKGNDTLTGGDGSDIFFYNKGDSNDLITDYAEEDKIKIASGNTSIKKNGKDIIFTIGNGKITVKGAASKTVTYVDTSGKTNYYPTTPSSPVILTDKNTTAILRETYSDSTYTATSAIKKIDASVVTRDLSITGNTKSNIILGGSEDDTIYGGRGNDTLQGSSGADVFTYASGDGNDTILDYNEEDKIQITSGNDVIFTIGSGKLTLAGAANKTVSYIEGGKTKTYGGSANNVFEDDNFVASNDLSSLIKSKTTDYSPAEIETSLKSANALDKLTYSISTSR